MSFETCNHNLPKERCFACNGGNMGSREPEKPARRAPKVRPTCAATNPAAKKYGRVVVDVRKGTKDALPSAFLDINETTDCVHIAGYPYFWAMREAMERAPNLSTIEITECVRNIVSEETKRLCAARGVAITVGYENPATGGDCGNRQHTYQKQRNFMRTLDAPQQASFDELLALQFRPALLASRYFQLNGEEEHLTLMKLAEAFGLSKQNFTGVSHEINAVLCYLGAPFPHSRRAEKIAAGLRAKVAKLRAQASA